MTSVYSTWGWPIEAETSSGYVTEKKEKKIKIRNIVPIDSTSKTLL
jgi:hypothetical protein